LRRLSLVLRALVDIGGAAVRTEQDVKQLQLTSADLELGVPNGFVDCGLVLYDGDVYFMSTFLRPGTEDDDFRFQEDDE
jgi:hypothetical protein